MKLNLFFEDNDRYTKEYLGALLRRLTLASWIIGILGVVFGLLYYKDQKAFSAGLLLAAGLISIAVGIFVKPLTFKELKKQAGKLVGEETKTLLRFYEDYVELHEGENHLRIDYKHIERVFTTDNLYVFQLGKNTGFYLPKTALTEEKKKDFDDLLNGPFKNLPRKPRGFFSNKK